MGRSTQPAEAATETVEHGIEFDEAVWPYEDFEIVDGHVEGGAFTVEFGAGYTVQIGVTSYDYERDGETRTNHVPIVAVSDESGAIVEEGEPNDSHDPRVAIENAKGSAEYFLRYPEEFGLDAEAETEDEEGRADE